MARGLRRRVGWFPLLRRRARPGPACARAVTLGRGLGILAFLSSRLAGAQLTRRELIGVAVSVVGLVMLGISLAGATGNGDQGDWLMVVVWFVASGVMAGVAIAFGQRFLSGAAAYGLAAGVLFASGDVVTKTVVSGGARMIFIPAMIAAYSMGTMILQLGFQRGGALTTAGMATLFTNALPIIAGTTLYSEPFPDGELGVLRGIAFTLLIAGAVLLSRPEPVSTEEAVPELELAGAR